MSKDVIFKEKDEILRNVGISRQEVGEVHYTWIIANFRHVLLDRLEDVLVSPEFQGPVTCDAKWCLEMIRSRYKKQPYISIRLRLLHSSQDSLKIKCGLWIIDKNDHQVFGVSQLDESFCSIKENYALRNSKFIHYDHLMHNLSWYLTGELMKIQCTIYVKGDFTNYPNVMHNKEIQIPESQLTKDFGALLEDTSYSDVVLCLDSKEFQCHKAILAARSPVFAAMFQPNMKEKEQNEVTIEEMEEKVLLEMLRFIYSNTVQGLEEIAAELLYAAHRYTLNDLKAMCEKQLIKQLSPENVVDVLVCADRGSSRGLKERAKGYILDNLKHMGGTDSWKSLGSSNPELLKELLQYCSHNLPSENVSSDKNALLYRLLNPKKVQV